MVDVHLSIEDDLQVKLSVTAADEAEGPESPEAEPPEEPELVEVEESMEFKVGVVAGEDGGLPRLSIELDGKVVATFAQTEEGREEFWRHMDTIRVAQATGMGLAERLQEVSVDQE